MEPAKETPIKLRLSGSGTNPEKLHIKDLIKLFEAFQKVLFFKAPKNLKKSTQNSLWEMNLLSVKDGGAGYGFGAGEKVCDSFEEITSSINNGNYKSIPQEAVGQIQFMKNLATKGAYGIEMMNGKVRAVVNEKTVLPKSHLIKDRTIIYGEVVRVGGIEKSKVMIATASGNNISCSVEKSTIKELAKRLYERVGLRGLAERRITDMYIESFTIAEILPYKEVPITEALEKVAPFLGSRWKGLSPEEIVKEIRRMRDE